jgi:hypothetical protein
MSASTGGGQPSAPPPLPHDQEVSPAPSATDAGMPAGRGTDGMAIAAMVAGIVSIYSTVFCWFLAMGLGAAAVAFGIESGRRIERSSGRLEGDGMAIAGIVTGVIGFLLGTAVMLLTLLWVGFLLFWSAIMRGLVGA